MKEPLVFLEIRLRMTRDRQRIHDLRRRLHKVNAELDVIAKELRHLESTGLWRPPFEARHFLERARVAIRSMDKALAPRDLKSKVLPPLVHRRRRKRAPKHPTA